MAKVTIEFQTGNAAFADDLQGEAMFILERAAQLITEEAAQDDVFFTHPLRDSNGNTVGKITIE